MPAMTEQGTADVQAEQLVELHAIRVAAQIIAVLLLLLILVGFIAIAGR